MKRDGYNRQRKRILWGVLMYKRGVIFFAGVAVLAALLLAGSFAHGQMVSVKQFPGATVATKLTNAQNNGCLIASTVCVLTIEPELSIFTEGTLPSRCANCWWIDYRSQSLGVRQGVGAGNSLVAVAGISFPLLAPDGSLGAPSYAFATTPSTGCFYLSNQIRCGISGTLSMAIASGLVTAPSFCMDPTISNDVCMVRDGANIWALKNGTNAQEARVYATTTGPAYLAIQANSTCTAGGGNITQICYDTTQQRLNFNAGGSGLFSYISQLGTFVPGSSTSAIKATTTNDSAAAGMYGEYTSSNIAIGSEVTLTTATTANVTSLSLTAGDWDVTGNCVFDIANTTSYTEYYCGISTTSATLPSAEQSQHYKTTAIVPLATTDWGFAAPTVRISIAGTTTVYMVTRAVFTVSTFKAYGILRARRVR